MKTNVLATLATFVLLAAILPAQVPQLLNYQGRVAVGTPAVNFDGTGLFRFALVNADASTTYWSNAPDAAPLDGMPDATVSLTVTKGLYSVLLGDTTLSNMSAIQPDVWTHPDVRLRVWFDDGTRGPRRLQPGHQPQLRGLPPGPQFSPLATAGRGANGTE